MAKKFDKIFYKLYCKAQSPLSLGSGNDENSDMDILVDAHQNPFIPGSSIAGVFSHSVEDSKLRKALFSNGVDKPKTDEKMSAVIVYDAYLQDKSLKNVKNKVDITVRENVGLGEFKSKIDGAKFNYEILETGNTFVFMFELDGLKDQHHEFEQLLARIDNGEIRFGHKTTRGYGCFSVEKALRKEFDENDLDHYLDFDLNNWESEGEFSLPQVKTEDVLKIDLSLKQLGGISIREYYHSSMDVDFKHIQCNGNPVIPGTSWAGAIRAEMIDTLVRLVGNERYRYKDALKSVEELFGSAKEERAKRSEILFEESVIDGGKTISSDHVKIDRFYGGASEHAKFNENAHYNGDTELKIIIKNASKHKEMVGLLFVVLQKMKYGLFGIGGMTSVGRGLFEVEEFNCTEDISEYIESLKAHVESRQTWEEAYG